MIYAYSKKTISFAPLFLSVIALAASPGILLAAPNVDGRFDLGEGYSSGHIVNFVVEGGGAIAATGELWFHVDGAGDVYIAFTQPKTLVDNTYGANSIGWGAAAPSGKNHNFKDLLGSDKAQFVFSDSQGNNVLDITLDYLYETAKNSGVYSSGLSGLGGERYDGKVNTGSIGDVLVATSSLDYNFNDAATGYVLTTDSPATDASYTPNATYPNWVFDVTYEMKIDGDIFGAGGFDISQLNIYIVHDSPNKIAKNKVWPKFDGSITSQGVIPEPLTVLGLFAGTAGIGGYLRKRTAARP